MSYGDANAPDRDNFYDIHEWNLDKTVKPHVMVRGAMGKDSGGTWRYLKVSASGALSNDDAANLRISAIGGTAGDNVIVDGTTQTISATLTPISANPAATIAGLVSHVNQPDGARLRISALSPDAGTFRISALGFSNTDAGQNRVSGIQGDAANQRVSAVVDNGSVSAKSSDAGTFKISGINIADSRAAGGATNYATSALNATAQTVKSSAGRLYGYAFLNRAGVDQWVQFFNVSGAPTVGTDTPALTVGIPANGGANLFLADIGAGFATGIVLAATSAPYGATLGASAVTVSLWYA